MLDATITDPSESNSLNLSRSAKVNFTVSTCTSLLRKATQVWLFFTQTRLCPNYPPCMKIDPVQYLEDCVSILFWLALFSFKMWSGRYALINFFCFTLVKVHNYIYCVTSDENIPNKNHCSSLFMHKIIQNWNGGEENRNKWNTMDWKLVK